MAYKIEMAKPVQKQLDAIKKSNAPAYKKAVLLMAELTEHPRTGTGQVEELKGNLSGYWSRRINKQYRLVYRIFDDRVVVEIVSFDSHYGQK